MFRKLFKRSRSRSRSHRERQPPVALDFKTVPTFSWSLDLVIDQTVIAESHSPSPFALLAVAGEIHREHGIPDPPAQLRLRHIASGNSTRIEPGTEARDLTEIVRRARPNFEPDSLIATETRTTLTSPDGEAVALGDVLARMRKAAAETAAYDAGPR